MSKARGKPRQDSVLRRQKPRAQHRRKMRLIVAGAAATLATCGLGLYLYVSPQQPALALLQAKAAPHRDWQLSLKLAGETALGDAAQADVLATAQNTLTDGSQDNLRKTARALQKLALYADVRLIRTAPHAVIISLSERQPVLCLEADRLRLVTASGEVYGEAVGGPVSCPGPVLSGLFDPEAVAALSLGSDMTLTLDKDSATLIREAVQLNTEAKAANLTLTHLEAKKYRGLIGTLRDRPTEVAFGHPPFGAKLEKLQGILDKLAQKQEQAARIELDYQGKAFIKLKKM